VLHYPTPANRFEDRGNGIRLYIVESPHPSGLALHDLGGESQPLSDPPPYVSSSVSGFRPRVRRLGKNTPTRSSTTLAAREGPGQPDALLPSCVSQGGALALTAVSGWDRWWQK
jgi:hypothetical protein